MPVDPELNPFAAELGRAAAAAAAPDKAPSRRELAKISGVGKTAVADWLAGKSLPRSWDDGAVLLVDAIIKFAARYGKRFPDEEAVRQRCRDAYYSARSAQPVNSTPGSVTPLSSVEVIAGSAETASRCAADDGSGPVGSAPESGSVASLPGGWRAKRTVLAVLVFAILAGTVSLTLLWWPAGKPVTPLISMKSSKCVSIDGDADEARAFQLDCTPEPGRKWYLQPATDDGSMALLFRIVNASNGKCLSYSEEMFGGAHVVAQRSCASGNNRDQLWNFVVENHARGDSWISGKFINMRSGLLLDINGESVADGAPVIQWQDNGKLNQHFRLINEAVS
ncbi:MAG: RICIN domain-containing protein [Pseudonocardiaceae bacterium]